ncbi:MULTISPECIES: Rv2175c family DNA-binding protein [unclassified Microbacterium]|uniref:Rv2175c family DNA-binding protein n=1 Tax=unclassified Microbacterium TaxID=2609290 RepID=UPI001E58B51B|nr:MULTISPECIES: Rv2175c family DNA-binding protein [unclassified Microbacterium]
MSDTPAWAASIEWLPLPAAAQLMGETPGRVRRLLDDHHLVAMRVDGALKIPADFFVDERPLPSLRGTIMVLLDRGFSTDEIMEWLFETEETMGDAPIAVLRSGRKSEVRRVAQSLG